MIIEITRATDEPATTSATDMVATIYRPGFTP